jgi:DNA invertase Pin-like site-specific DNA recombinase
MSTIHLHQTTTSTPEQYISGLTDFGPGRSKLFGNSADEYLKVHNRGGLQIVETYTDHGVSGTKARRPALDKMMEDARRHRFNVVVVWSCDRLARSTKHLLQVLDELNGFGIQFLSQREAIDTEGPLGRAIIVIVSAIAELERSLIVERVRAGMRRAKLEGRQIGRARLDINREQVVIDRRAGISLTQVAKRHNISRASVCRLMKESNNNSTAAVLVPAGNLAAHSAVAGSQ